MRIAVNTRFLLRDYMEGYGHYTAELFRRIVLLHPEHEFFFLFDRPYDESFVFAKNVTALVIGPQARHSVLIRWWFDVSVTRTLKKIKADVFVSPDGFCSTTTSIPQLLVIHDLAFLHYPQFISGSHLRLYKSRTPKSITRAKKIIAVSAFTKQDIIDKYEVTADKVSVIYNGARAVFQPVTAEERKLIKETYADGKEYFIYVGSIHPRKNLYNLLKAFSVFKKRLRSNMKLLIVGRLAWKYDAFVKSLDSYKFRNDVKLMHHVSDDELVSLLASSYALVYPSYFEGFGLPLVEAMACRVPVICSNRSALPEVGGNAALLFEPDNYEEMADRMMLIYKDETFRSKLIENGGERLPLFNWDKAATDFWQEIIATAQA
jgi:glycosyltransferase involved in cell wall biosynthesis